MKIAPLFYKRIFWLLLVLLLTSCGKSEKVFTKLPADAVILAFGDSLTFGTGTNSPNQESYPNLLAQLSGHKVINAGVPGEISADGLKRLPEVLDKEHPQLLILIHGGNDILRNLPREETTANLIQMIAEAKKRDIKVVMMGVPKFNLFSAVGFTDFDSAQIYKEVAKAEQVPIDLETIPKIISKEELKSDQVHPNAEGYKVLADAVFKLLQNSGAL